MSDENTRPIEVALALSQRGLHIIPIAPGQKAAVDKNWNKLRLTVDDVEERWNENPDYGIGLLLGTEVAPSTYLVAIDVDRDEELLISRVQRAIGGNAPAKKGAKGITYICRAEAPLKKVNIKRQKEAIATIEILGHGQQTVLPPSLHPKGMSYEWQAGPQLLDFTDFSDLPLIDDNVIRELTCAARNPDAKLFAVNDFVPSLDGQPGNMHNSGVEAAASFVAFGFKDDWIIRRILRGMREADRSYGYRDRDYAREERNVTEWVESARKEGFEVPSKNQEAADVTFCKWLIDEWMGGGCIYGRGGQMLIYEDGYYRAHTPEQFYGRLARCGNDLIMGLGSRGWKLITDTIIPMVPELPKIVHHKVCLLNGTLDMDTGELAPWSKADYLISQLPFNFDPDAKCQRYMQFVAETFAHEDEEESERALNCFEEYVAMCMFECHDYHRFLVLEGSTRAGKSVLCHVARMMQSPDAVSSVMAHDFGNETSRTSMLGKLVNITGETSTVNAVSDDYLKLIVGGDPVQVRHLYHGAYTTILPTRLIIATNDPLRTKDTSGAVMERMIALRCDNFLPIARRDPQLPQKLEKERAGILNRMIRAWARLRERNRFKLPKSSEELAERFHYDNNPVMRWVTERTHQGRMIDNPDYRLPERVSPFTDIGALYIDYADWSKLNGFGQMSVVTFGMKLTQLRIEGFDFSTQVKKVGKTSIRGRNLSLLSGGGY